MREVEEVRKLIEEDIIEEFDKRVLEQVEELGKSLESNKYINERFSIGLELETYSLNKEGLVTPIPKEGFNNDLFAPEIGVHNIEINTPPDIFNEEGVYKQHHFLEDRFTESRNFLTRYGIGLVLDSFSNEYKNSINYLNSVEERENLVFAENMTDAPRYHAIDNSVLRKRGGELEFRVPGIKKEFKSLLFESLATSVQVHLQVPRVDEFTSYYNIAIRTMAPILALSTNSPILPSGFYGSKLPKNFFHEYRIPIFEQCVDPYDADFSDKKVRFPKDIEEISDLIREVGHDESYTGCLQEWRDTRNSPQKEFWEWNYKLREFWRWIRPVLGGESIKGCCSNNSLRIEYRPLPTQPSIKENISLQLLTTGLIHGLFKIDHPITELEWKKTKEDFYKVIREGLDAEIHWINIEREDTTEKDEIYEEIFNVAEIGLKDMGIGKDNINRYLEPFKQRWIKRKTPSQWKIQNLKENISNNKDLREAIHETNEKYHKNSRNHESFVSW